MNFTDLHDKLVQFDTGLIKQREFDGWLEDNITVKKYFSIVTKYALIEMLKDNLDSLQLNDSEDIYYIYMTFDIQSMFTFLSRYISIDIPFDKRTTVNYDLMMRTGFVDYVMQTCGKDYNELVSKAREVIGLENMNVIKAVAQIFSGLMDTSDLEKIQETVNNLDKENLKFIQNIQEFNDPTTKKVVNELKKSAAEEAISKQKDKNTEQKKSNRGRKKKTPELMVVTNDKT